MIWSYLNKVGVWLSLVRALRSGRKSRRFESSHPDHFILNSFISTSYTRFFCLNSALKWTTNWTTPQGKCVSWQQKSRISSSVMASITSGVVSPRLWPVVVPVKWKSPLKQAIWLITSLKFADLVTLFVLLTVLLIFTGKINRKETNNSNKY